MRQIDKVSFLKKDGFEERVNFVLKKLRDDGFVVVDFSDILEENYLLTVVASLGIIEKEDIVSEALAAYYANSIQTKGSCISHNVQVPSLLTMIKDFPLHTDDYSSENPSDIVVLECLSHSSLGGDTLVAKLTDIMSKLQPAVIDILMSNIFPCNDGTRPILWKESEIYKIRFNQREIKHLCQSQKFELSSIAKLAIEDLASMAKLSSRQTHLLPRECIFINNKSVMHGRTAFPQDSGRLLRRMKVKLKS